MADERLHRLHLDDHSPSVVDYASYLDLCSSAFRSFTSRKLAFQMDVPKSSQCRPVRKSDLRINAWMELPLANFCRRSPHREPINDF